MKSVLKKKRLTRLLDAAQRRFQRARPGSVLIMVVSLLVLLALIGTAAMSTARVDRQASQNHVATVQVELLVEGLRQMVLSQAVADLFAGSWGSTTDSPASDPLNGQNEFQDAYLASRFPERLAFPGKLPMSNDAPSKNTIVWRNIGFPPVKNGNPWHYDPPNKDSAGASYDLALPKFPLQPTSLVIGGVPVPALQEINPKTGAVTSRPAFMAADTDADGIADSLWFRLPVSPTNGITWYGAARRVIDNNSAININTAGEGNYAWASTLPAPATPNPALVPVTIPSIGGSDNISVSGWFPYSVALYWLDDIKPSRPMIADPGEIAAWDAQRFTGSYSAGSAAAATMKLTAVSTNAAGATLARNDFDFMSSGDALWHQLGRRLDNPGFYADGKKFGNGARPFSISDSIALAHNFVLLDPRSSGSTAEAVFKVSTFGNSIPYLTYQPENFGTWFTDNFDYETTNRVNARPLLTAYNPVRNTVRRHFPDAAHAFFTAPLTASGNSPPFRVDLNTGLYTSKTNLNTAIYEELLQSFYDVMCDPENANSTQFDDAAGFAIADPYFGTGFLADAPFTSDKDPNHQHPLRMFRSPIRGNENTSDRLHPYQTMILRAAIAAANVEALRGVETDRPTYHQISIPQAGGLKPFIVDVYGLKRQPFITEVFLNSNVNPLPADPAATGPPPQNKAGFAAIELHNPYDVAIALDEYHIKVVDRSRTGKAPILPSYLGVTEILDDATKKSPLVGKSIPAHGYLVIWNYSKTPAGGDTDSAQYVPGGLKDDLGGGKTIVSVAHLTKIIGNELLITRDTQGGGDAPIDSFDSTGLVLEPAPPDGEFVGPVYGWHYSRSNNPNAPVQRAWNFVYPGRYDASPIHKGKGYHQGTITETWNPKDDPKKIEPWAVPTTPPIPPILLGDADDVSTREIGGATFPIQIFASASPRYTDSAGRLLFPFGGFARAGDVMRAPFIGSYKIRDGDNLVEINAVTLDSVFAEDTDTDDDLYVDPFNGARWTEDIGRFSPLKVELNAKTVVGGATTRPAPASVRYGWARNILDYFTTINSPADDYLPSADPNRYSPQPDPVKNVGDTYRGANRLGEFNVPKGPTEDDVCTEGLININTANWKVLASLPLVLDKATGKVDRNLTETLAKRIVYFRDVDAGSGIGWGPFRSIMELNLVPGFDTAMDTIIFDNALANDPGPVQGDMSPLGVAAAATGYDKVRGDFEEKYLNLTRISNLLTLRSDTFTAYIMVQGWRNAGTPQATLVAQRRAAFIIDRSKLTRTKKSPNVYNIPMP